MCKVHHVNTIYMTSEQLFSQIRSKRSFLCVGLDTDVNKIPRHLLSQDDPVFAFNRAIVDATAPYAVCYKPNMAFYEESGAKGWESFRRTVGYIRERYPDMLIIADAKRGDIGNTSKMYARAFFSENLADAVTVSPYMGYDTVGLSCNTRGNGRSFWRLRPIRARPISSCAYGGRRLSVREGDRYGMRLGNDRQPDVRRRSHAGQNAEGESVA